MRLLALVAMLASLVTPALAQTPLTAEEFEAYVTGKTLTYRQFDVIFGVEEYLPNRKVHWSVALGECQYGSWYPEDRYICFVYEYSPSPNCWTFWIENGVLAALSDTGQPGEELYEVDRSDQPLGCPGPEVGV